MKAGTLRSGGFTVLELVVVAAVVATAAGLALLVVSVARNASDLMESRAMVAAALRRASSEAARSGAAVTLDVGALPVPATIRTALVSPSPLPETALVAEWITFQGGTGRPYVGGANAAAAVVLVDRSDQGQVVAVVVGATAAVRTFRFNGATWEEL